MKLMNKIFLAAQVAGTVYFLILAMIIAYAVDGQYFGELIYNYYLISLLEGQSDIPVRIIGLEGHLTPDGRAYVYHGLAPLLPRLLAAPFVDLSVTSIAPFSIWLFGSAGTAIYALTFSRALTSSELPERQLKPAILTVTGLIWLTSPVMLLLGNHAFFSEPIAVAYFSGAGVLFCAFEITRHPDRLSRWVIPMSCFAALSVHARPALAVGLYAIICALIAWQMLRTRIWFPDARQIAGLFICFTSGVLFLSFNYLRFGDVFFTHGGFEPGPVEYGYTYWGIVSHDSEWARSMTEHGQFNVFRVIPNLLAFIFRLAPFTPWLDNLHTAVLSSQGAVYKDPIQVGLLYIWLPWFILIGMGFRYWKQLTAPKIIILGATGFSSVLLLSYPAVATRYSADLWPFVATLVLIGLPHTIRQLGQHTSKLYIRSTIVVFTLMALVFSHLGLFVHSILFQETGEAGMWTYSHCLEMVQERGFEPSEYQRLCEPPAELLGMEWVRQ